MNGAYYNEIDSFAAAWLRELIKAGLIADGEVDERSIADVRPDDLRGFRQCHFFAGIGGWSYALRLAGWPDDREVWTGSCPCQPFSSAGAQTGEHDPRDLWPAWFQLLAECRPHVVFGEQVEAAIGHGWLDRLCDDLESEDYAIGPCGLPGPCVGAYDIRQRLWFVADAGRERRQQERRSASGDEGQDGRRSHRDYLAGSDGENNMAYTEGERGQRLPAERRAHVSDGAGRGEVGHMGDTSCGGFGIDRSASRHTRHADEPITSFWSDADWLPCTDGKARPVEPGTFPLAYGVSARVGRLCGYGNAIKPPLAAEFIKAYREVLGEDLHGL